MKTFIFVCLLVVSLGLVTNGEYPVEYSLKKEPVFCISFGQLYIYIFSEILIFFAVILKLSLN